MLRLKRSARCLRGKGHAGINFECQDPFRELTLHTDPDWGTEQKTRRSLSGGVLFHGNHLLQRGTRVQPVVASSSGDWEFSVAVRGIGNLVCIGNGMTELYPHEKWSLHSVPWTHLQEKAFSCEKEAGSVQHFHVKTLWVQECIKSWNVVVHRISREDNPEDALAISCSVTDPMKHIATAGLTFEPIPVASCH